MIEGKEAWLAIADLYGEMLDESDEFIKKKGAYHKFSCTFITERVLEEETIWAYAQEKEAYEIKLQQLWAMLGYEDSYFPIKTSLWGPAREVFVQEMRDAIEDYYL